MKSWQLLIVGVFIGLIAGGMIFLISSARQSPEMEFISPTQKTTVVIFVSGEVKNPGLYSLPVGSRVNDAVLAAGGVLDDAVLNEINLAKILEDGEHVLISTTSTSDSSQSSPQSEGKIDINQATLEELDSLPGIGAAKAQAIIDFRTKNGFFHSIDDLLYVPGIGPSIVNSIRDQIEIK